MDSVSWLDEINDGVASAASKSQGELDMAQPSSSITTGGGMITVQWRLSTGEVNIERDDNRMFMSMTGAV